jgi:hypothetical protein
MNTAASFIHNGSENRNQSFPMETEYKPTYEDQGRHTRLDNITKIRYEEKTSDIARHYRENGNGEKNIYEIDLHRIVPVPERVQIGGSDRKEEHGLHGG